MIYSGDRSAMPVKPRADIGEMQKATGRVDSVAFEYREQYGVR